MPDPEKWCLPQTRSGPAQILYRVALRRLGVLVDKGRGFSMTLWAVVSGSGSLATVSRLTSHRPKLTPRGSLKDHREWPALSA
jgi:hypothetical protein